MPSKVINETDSNHDYKIFDWRCESVVLPLWSLDQNSRQNLLREQTLGSTSDQLNKTHPRPTPGRGSCLGHFHFH